ncbi:alpha-soluble NSF attachment protein-like [Impatiens glandulifera]|uniref:alpha-soluble NSF attachment protein-like n=1 Tax=Impatiens glandulifera TaxID=253017 RepID=UPI001FB0B6AC|nr:alpha-soluble NSF attachment protein-like [Impatiens glandulifera]
MANQIAKGEDFQKQAEKKLTGWGLFTSKHEDAAELFDKAANAFKLAKSWEQAGAVYVKLANCHLKSDSKHEAATAYADAAHSYKKIQAKESVSYLEESVNLFMEIGRLNMAAKYYKEIAEIYESGEDLEKAIIYYERATDLFQSEDVTTSANQCRQKIAQFAAQLEQYQKAIEIYEDIARQSLSNNLLKYGVKGHLLNAGICQLCKGNGDSIAINNGLERYQDLDPTFAGSREYRLLVDLAEAIDEEDIDKFTGALKEYDSMTQLDAWKTTLLLRVKDMIKAKELEEDDLT